MYTVDAPDLNVEALAELMDTRRCASHFHLRIQQQVDCPVCSNQSLSARRNVLIVSVDS